MALRSDTATAAGSIEGGVVERLLGKLNARDRDAIWHRPADRLPTGMAIRREKRACLTFAELERMPDARRHRS